MVNQLSLNEVLELYEKRDPNNIFIDVREPNEWVLGVIPGITKISLSDIPNHIDKFDKNKKYVMVCRSGARSNRISDFLAGNGFNDVNNFSNGMLAWYDADFPVET